MRHNRTLDSIQTTDKKRRSRDETRIVEVFAPGSSLANTEWDGHVSAIIRVNRDVLTRSASTGLRRSTSETALFVSGVVLPAAQCAKAIRDHWSIENCSHYVRDGSFAEDASRIRCNPGTRDDSYAEITPHQISCKIVTKGSSLGE